MDGARSVREWTVGVERPAVVARRIEESPLAKAAVVAGCAYEVVAVTTGLIPPITTVCRRFPSLGAALVAALVWHFRREETP